ncbi:hypothetical protein [Rosistilla oblonga]|nr:hypothetical protein [Rosistilla oblonga]
MDVLARKMPVVAAIGLATLAAAVASTARPTSDRSDVAAAMPIDRRR